MNSCFQGTMTDLIYDLEDEIALNFRNFNMINILWKYNKGVFSQPGMTQDSWASDNWTVVCKGG